MAKKIVKSGKLLVNFFVNQVGEKCCISFVSETLDITGCINTQTSRCKDLAKNLDFLRSFGYPENVIKDLQKQLLKLK